ncbi:hypothetical protein [Saccharothrix sp. ALI-22-I]|nr:hypothetical protein [Saccharothrix sp. ALI-22-I]
MPFGPFPADKRTHASGGISSVTSSARFVPAWVVMVQFFPIART